MGDGERVEGRSVWNIVILDPTVSGFMKVFIDVCAFNYLKETALER